MIRRSTYTKRPSQSSTLWVWISYPGSANSLRSTIWFWRKRKRRTPDTRKYAAIWLICWSQNRMWIYFCLMTTKRRSSMSRSVKRVGPSRGFLSVPKECVAGDRRHTDLGFWGSSRSKQNLILYYKFPACEICAKYCTLFRYFILFSNRNIPSGN